jgi:hypothetical protein
MAAIDEQPESLLGEVQMVYRKGKAVWLICSSEHDDDFGTVFTVETTSKHYLQTICDYDLHTLRGCLVMVDDGAFEIVEEPRELPTSRAHLPLRHRARNGVAVVPTNGINKWPWGRCCCVPHPETGAPSALTEPVLQTGVSWWPSPRTPFELDLQAAAANKLAMHIVPDTPCPSCGHDVWYIEPEEEPEESVFTEMDRAARIATETAHREDEALCEGLDGDAELLASLLDVDEDMPVEETGGDLQSSLDAADAAIERLRRLMEAP